MCEMVNGFCFLCQSSMMYDGWWLVQVKAICYVSSVVKNNEARIVHAVLTVEKSRISVQQLQLQPQPIHSETP